MAKQFRESRAWALHVVGSMLAVPVLAVLIAPTSGVPAVDPEADTSDQPPMLSPQEAVGAFQLPDDFEIQLVAAEPDLVNPMTMTLDDEGRVYVSQAHTYRYGPDHAPVDSPGNPVVRLKLDGSGSVVDRVVVATGFANPVMGLAVREDQLWATNLNEVFVADLDERGKVTSRRTIVRDAATPWNPFGMYRLEFGPDGWLYLSVGDHPISLTGPTNNVAVRGNTGGVFRFRPDGGEIELLAQGVRAPFSFDIDPFGRHWLISNGEGNPNRLIHAIPTADYHFQTRSVDWEWLAGRNPLAPPVWENPAGAHTAVLAYRSDAFPEEYWGNLFVSNWGVHGFPSANHVIIRHVIDEHGRRLRSEPFLTTTDPYFRPTQIRHAPDGSIYVLDWYGRDDENDLTGRLYRIVYTGDHPTTTATVKSTGGLASRNHDERARTCRKLLAAEPAAADVLRQHVTGPDALAAAEALWVLAQSDLPEATSLLELGLDHSYWRVRRLAVQLLDERGGRSGRLAQMRDDPEPAVAIEAAMSTAAPAERLAALAAVLRRGAAEYPRHRYQAALEVARHGTPVDFAALLGDPDDNVRLAGLIALDEAFHEGSKAAAGVLAGRIAEPRQVALLELLAIGERWPHEALVAPVVGQLNRDITIAQFARGLAILRHLGVATTPGVLGDAVERLLSNVTGGDVSMTLKSDRLAALGIVAIDPSTPSALPVVALLTRDTAADVRAAAHRALVAGAAGDDRFTTLCWELVRDDTADIESRIDALASLVKVESRCSTAWLDLLNDESPQLALAALRSVQIYAGQAEALELLSAASAEVNARGEPFARELRHVQGAISGASPAVSATGDDNERAALRGRLLAQAAAGDPLLGRLAFRRGACGRCHLAAEDDTLLGPSLKGVAKTNGPEYIVDSVLYPSRVIKTGFMVEVVVTDDGRSITGKVSDHGDTMTITTATGEQHRLARGNVEQRQQVNQSLMPEALETSMSEAELTDLIAYLLTQ